MCAASADKAIKVGPGDLIQFGLGLRYRWKIEEPLTTHSVSMDEHGEEMFEEALSCDRCGKECSEKSWLVGEGDEAEDVCVECFQKAPVDGARYQEHGMPADLQPTATESDKSVSNSVQEQPVVNENPSDRQKSEPIDAAESKKTNKSSRDARDNDVEIPPSKRPKKVATKKPVKAEETVKPKSKAEAKDVSESVWPTR